ncbi:hypothetical protein MLD38_034353 [Melastoma candidum]|uniref:Uncharacterized protein n=1 Tax=Melastoma candidum TaxID=119954 RepID=A0ACB9M9T3_9MYRT|nr:hypothetical protein MLD38_034353 [Melastoma candidum]
MEGATRKVAIVGAGISGLLACRHLMEKGFDPVVYEASGCIGGVWSHTIESTKLQTPKHLYQFSDFPWPDTVEETFPDHRQVMEYITSYAEHFKVLPKIKFNCRVTGIDYELMSNCGKDDNIECWEQWSGSADLFSGTGRWSLTINDRSGTATVYRADFVILCIGMFSDLPRLPEFLPERGPEVFRGKVLHSMDYVLMEKGLAAELIRDKRVTVVGFQKSAVDIAAEVSKINGNRYPCTLLFRCAHWLLPDCVATLACRNLNRLTEYMIHKPREGFFLWLLATLALPLLWIHTKILETYLKLAYPLRKHEIIPDRSLIEQFRTCTTPLMPEKFFDAVNEGSILLKKSPTFGFCEDGLILEGEESNRVSADVVIFATGWEYDKKLTDIFSSEHFRTCIAGSSAPLYRDCIHPRIPQLAILGYVVSPSVMYTTEMRSKWLAHLLAGGFTLPKIQEMEQDVNEWERYARKFCKDKYERRRAGVLLQIHCNDLILRDMGLNPRRKKNFLAELFSSYGPADYRNV